METNWVLKPWNPIRKSRMCAWKWVKLTKTPPSSNQRETQSKDHFHSNTKARYIQILPRRLFLRAKLLLAALLSITKRIVPHIYRVTHEMDVMYWGNRWGQLC